MSYLFRLLLVLSTTFLMLHCESNKLLVGTKVAPPFAMKDKQGNWEGISIDLWKLIANRLDIKYEFLEFDLKTLLKNVEKKDIDIAIAAITITSERERKFDFTHSYYTTGLSIATLKPGEQSWVQVIKRFFSYKFLFIIFFLVFILFIIGTIEWLAEKKKNPESFNPNPIKGIASGMWWAAVTMTTVGYGDMTPKTLAGRLIALFWMFTSFFLVSYFVASVASTITVNKMNQFISQPEDLSRGKVATIQGSVSDTYLKNIKIYPYYYDSLEKALIAIKEKKVDATVYDAPLLQYTIKKNLADEITMLSSVFEIQSYGIALPENSKLRETINRVLLEILHSKEWESIKYRYLGE